MEHLSFDPRVGEMVGALGHHGLFKIVDVEPSGHIAPPGLQNPKAGITALGTADLKLEGSDFKLTGVPWSALVFDEARPLRLLVDWMKRERILDLPEGVGGPEIRMEDRFDGEPQFVVSFYANPKVEADRETIRRWNDFTSKVREEIYSRLRIDRWVEVSVRQEQELLYAAS